MVNAAGKLPPPPPPNMLLYGRLLSACMHISFAHSPFSTTRYLHPEDDAAVSGRRSSVPTVYSSASCTPVDRRGPEPALLQAESRQECSRSEFVGNVADPPNNIKHLAADNSQEQSQDISPFNSGNWHWLALIILHLSLQRRTLTLVLLCCRIRTQKLLKYVMGEMSWFAQLKF